MSEAEKSKDEKKGVGLTRQDRLKQIEALYRTQIKQIYSDSKEKVQQAQQSEAKPPAVDKVVKKLESRNSITNQQIQSPSRIEKGLSHIRSANNLLLSENPSSSKYINFGGQGDVRASVYLRGQSTRNIQMLRKQNETKQLKIRELTHKCQSLIDKLKKHVQPGQLQHELESLKEYSENKNERLENLFKIKNQEIFFKIKLQIISLLQEFGINKDQLNDVNEVSNETSLFSYMSRKLKGRLKDFRSKEQQSNFEIQKDRIVNQKHEERIHYLTQTNQLLRLSEGKLKTKVEDLKSQLNEFLERLKLRQQENQQRQNEIFRLRKQNQQLNSANHKLSTAVKGVNGQKVDERRIWEAKQKQLKTLLNNYVLEKNKLENELQEKEGQNEEIIIKQKFLQQENERINRQLIRWKQRYQWLQKQKQGKIRQIEDQKNQLISSFEQYRLDNNQGVIMGHRSEVDEANRKIEEYQKAYQNALSALEEERSLLLRSQEQAEEKIQLLERQWLERVKKLEKDKQEEIDDINNDNEVKLYQMREEFEQKEKLLAEEMQARMRALLAERDKKTTEQLIALQTENDDLHKQIQNLHKLIEVKQSLINVFQSKNNWSAK